MSIFSNKSGQKFDQVDLHQLTERAGIGDDHPHQKPSRRKPSRALSRSSSV
jgi:hypothetical protein